MKYGINTKKLLRESYFLEGYKAKKKELFYKQHQTKIWLEIITISGIKGAQMKNKHYKWKTCWVNSIIPLKSVH